jgi:hypothetical protein
MPILQEKRKTFVESDRYFDAGYGVYGKVGGKLLDK